MQITKDDLKVVKRYSTPLNAEDTFIDIPAVVNEFAKKYGYDIAMKKLEALIQEAVDTDADGVKFVVSKR